MEQNDQIKEFFQQHLSNHQEVVRPEIWSAVSSAIAAPALVKTGLSVISKTVIGIGIAASVLVSAYLFYASESKETNKPSQEKKKTKEVPPIPTNNNTLVKIETKKNTIPLIVLENNDLLSSEVVVYDVNDSKTIPFESVQPPNTAPLQDMGENVSNNPVKTNNDFIVIPQVESAHELTLSAEKDQELKLVLSNVFTPNGDGTNDYLFIQSEGLLDFSVVVLNQKNQIIYQSTDAKFSWDGKLANGEEVPAANYIYFVTAKSSNGKFIQQSSTLLIQR